MSLSSIGVTLMAAIAVTFMLRLMASVPLKWLTPARAELVTCVTYGLLGALTIQVLVVPVAAADAGQWPLRLGVAGVALCGVVWFRWRLMWVLLAGGGLFAALQAMLATGPG